MNNKKNNKKCHGDIILNNNGSFIQKVNNTCSHNNHYLSSTHSTSAFTLWESLVAFDIENGIVDENFHNCGKKNPAFESKGWNYPPCGRAECPLCYMKKKRDRLSIFKLVEQNMADYKYKDDDPKPIPYFPTQMVTLTFTDVSYEQIDLLHQFISTSFTKLSNNFNSKKMKRIIAGMLKGEETSITDTGLYHIHIHILLAYNNFVFNENFFDRKSKKTNKLKLVYFFKIEEWIKQYILKCFNKNLQKYKEFQVKSIHFTNPEEELNLESFIEYVTKIPENIEREEWISWKNHTKNKNLFTATGIFRYLKQELDLIRRNAKALEKYSTT